MIRAKIAEGHKIFSLTQKAGGPVKTKIKMDASESYKLSEFRWLQEPKKYAEPSFNNMEVEVHQGVVTWYAPLEIAAEKALDSLEIKGKVKHAGLQSKQLLRAAGLSIYCQASDLAGEQDLIDLPKNKNAN